MSRVLDGAEGEGHAGSLGAKLKTVFDKLLKDYSETSLLKATSDLLSRAAYHFQTNQSGVKIEDNTVFAKYVAYNNKAIVGRKIAAEVEEEIIEKPAHQIRAELRSKVSSREREYEEREHLEARFIEHLLSREVPLSADTARA